ncbi:hypothetical protein H2203_009277, partial [Taxawa tesnikishii (nom. ined.)]
TDMKIRLEPPWSLGVLNLRGGKEIGRIALGFDFDFHPICILEDLPDVQITNSTSASFLNTIAPFLDECEILETLPDRQTTNSASASFPDADAAEILEDLPDGQITKGTSPSFPDADPYTFVEYNFLEIHEGRWAHCGANHTGVWHLKGCRRFGLNVTLLRGDNMIGPRVTLERAENYWIISIQHG